MINTKLSNTDTVREKTKEAAKRYRASWVEVAQYLYTIYKDKLYRDWNYVNFETYCARELQIKQSAAVKMLKSYYFLEKEEPEALAANNSDDTSKASAPNFEAVNLLRLAKTNKKITPAEFRDLRQAVFEKEKEPKEVRAQIRQIVSEKEPKDLRQEKDAKRNTVIKRLITFLSNAKRELENDELVPVYLLKQMNDLAIKLEDQLN